MPKFIMLAIGKFKIEYLHVHMEIMHIVWSGSDVVYSKTAHLFSRCMMSAYYGSALYYQY